MGEEGCTAIVPDGPTSLAETGGPGLTLVLCGAVLVLLGVIVLLVSTRRRREAAVMAVLLVLATVAGGALRSAAPASASEHERCPLLGLSEIARHPENVLVPGGKVELLAYTVSNISPFPIEVSVRTKESTAGTDLGAHLDLIVQVDGEAAATGLLSAAPVTSGTRIQPGDAIQVGYLGGLDGPTPSTQHTAFDSFITARQLAG